MDVPRFHKPRWADICDECGENDCICGERSRLAQGCECSRTRNEIVELLKKLRLDKPERFKGIFLQGHEPCRSCTKYVYSRLKHEKAKQSLTRPRPGKLSQAIAEVALPMPYIDSPDCSGDEFGSLQLVDTPVRSFDLPDRSEQVLALEDGDAFEDDRPQARGRRSGSSSPQRSQFELRHTGGTDPPPQDGAITTLMLCDIPCGILRKDIITALDSEGFAGKYDHVHVPGTPGVNTNLGYAFINFVGAEAASSFWTKFKGYRFAGSTSPKVCSVRVARLQRPQGNAQQRRQSKARVPGLESDKVITLSLERATADPNSMQTRKRDTNQVQCGPSSVIAPPGALLNAAYSTPMWYAWPPSLIYCHSV